METTPLKPFVVEWYDYADELRDKYFDTFREAERFAEEIDNASVFGYVIINGEWTKKHLY